MGAGASVVTKEEVEKLPQYTILGGKLKLAGYNYFSAQIMIVKITKFFSISFEK